MSTTVVKFNRGRPADDDARKWIVRIDAGPLTAEERVQLRAWLAEDPKHAELLDSQALLWAAASRAQFPAQAAKVKPRSSWWQRSGLSGSPRLITAFASLIVAVVVAVPVVRERMQQSRNLEASLTVSTKVGERRPIALPDGSHTELNASSGLRVAFRADRRRVFLERGEGLFEVAKDKTRPFEVVAGDTTVRAVGTRFLVSRHDDGRVEVTVYEGVVEVTQRTPDPGHGAPTSVPNAAPEPMKLGVGQVAISEPDHTLIALAEGKSMARKLAWQSGRLEFDQTPMDEVLEQVNRYSDKPIRLSSEELKDVRVSGSFSTQNTNVFLRSLEQGFGFTVQRTSEGWLLSKAK